ncbi:MAG: DinB family protein [Planctomycetota bacterium]
MSAPQDWLKQGRTPWFERTFSYDTPSNDLHEVLCRLAGTPVRLEELVAGLDAAALTRRVDDTWSAQENIGHLLDLEPLWVGRTADLLERREELRAADLSNTTTHGARHNEANLDGLLATFRSVRGDWLRSLRQFDDDQIRYAAQHPRLGTPMRIIDLAEFVAAHDDHHIARVHELCGWEPTG